VIERVTLPGAREDKLYFAQVREDPLLEIEALGPSGPLSGKLQAKGGPIVVVSSGGCTALSLLAAGAERVVAVDLNPVQNHLVELKAEALTAVDPAEVVAFLGGAPMEQERRLALYEDVRPRLSSASRTWWDGHRRAIGRGVLTAGVTERFIGLVMKVLRLGIHPPSRIRRLLAARSLEEQQALYRREWDTRRWHLLFQLLLNRAVFRKAYHPAFFEHVENPSFANHFRGLAEHSLTQVPIATNYFVHQMLTGFYPTGVPGGLPPYLDPDGVAAATRRAPGLTLVDAGYTDYLRTCADRSVAGFALSNICEWFTAEQVDDLFAEVVRTAAPGARLVFRNFVGWTEVPERWQDVLVEDRRLSEELIKRDRSAVQRRIAVCRVET
jgi:S-adenosylmethionine-diacylglycerol 3-amino-3-carboxypropyl transferase